MKECEKKVNKLVKKLIPKIKAIYNEEQKISKWLKAGKYGNRRIRRKQDITLVYRTKLYCYCLVLKRLGREKKLVDEVSSHYKLKSEIENNKK